MGEFCLVVELTQGGTKRLPCLVHGRIVLLILLFPKLLFPKLHGLFVWIREFAMVNQYFLT